MELILLIWIASGLICGAIASRKGRSSGGWFALGLLFGPLALLAIAVASPNEAALERAGLQSRTLRRCPQCAEVIQSKATVCRHCGASVTPPRYDFWGRELR
jgi:hypothetical protein